MRRAAWVLLLCAGVAACGSARRGEPIVGPIALSVEAQRGRQVFSNICQQCHPGGETGLAPAINNRPLPGFAIEWQVRNGLGAMPSFPPHEIGEEELDAVVAYLMELRRAD